MPDKSKSQSLRDHPDIAIDIAVYIGNFNTMEAMLHLVVAQMLNDQHGVVHAFLSPWNSFASKLDIIVDIAKIYATNPQAVMVLQNEQTIRDANTFRNLLAHAAYSVEGEEVSALSFLVSSRKPKATPITTELLSEKKALLKGIIDAMIAAIKTSTGEDGNVYRRAIG